MRKINLLFSFLIFLSSSVILTAQDYDSLANAVYEKDLNKINEILDSGVNVDITTADHPATVLYLASGFEGYEDVVSLLVSRGANVNFKGEDGKTPLMWAAGNSYPITKILIDNGAKINEKANDGMTAFLQSCFGILSKKVTTDVLDLLLKNGANVNDVLTSKDAPGWTALLFASINCDYDLAKYLIQHGAKVNHTSDEGTTALSLAKQEKFDNIIMLLKKHGALE